MIDIAMTSEASNHAWPTTVEFEVEKFVLKKIWIQGIYDKCFQQSY